MIRSCKRSSLLGLYLCGAWVVVFASGCGSESPSELLIRAQEEIDRGNDDKAIALLNEAIARKPDFGHALGKRGRIYSKRDQHEQAMKDLSMAIDFLPKDEAISYYCQRAVVCREQGGSQSATALQDCDVIIRHHTEEDLIRAMAFAIRAWSRHCRRYGAPDGERMGYAGTQRRSSTE